MNKLELSFGSDYQLFEEMVSKLISWTPYVIGLILYLLITIILFKFIIFLASKILNKINLEENLKRLIPSLELDEIKINFPSIIIAFLKIIMILLFVVFGAELFGLEIVSTQISNLMAYLPRVLVSFILIIIALAISSSVSKLLMNILQGLNFVGAKFIAKIISTLILLVMIIIAVELVGIDTSIITTNISIILAGMMASVAIAIGLGSVELVRRILFGFYLKKNFKIGQVIKMDGINGKILAIDGISVTILGQEETYVIPIRHLVDNQVSILQG